jgi:hypothetical protein
VRTTILPGRARPSGPKLSVLFQRSYAFSRPCADHPWVGRNHTGSFWVGAGCHPNRDSQTAIAAAGFAIGPLERFKPKPNSLIARPFLQGRAARPTSSRTHRRPAERLEADDSAAS